MVAGTTSNYTIDPTTAGILPSGYTNTGLAYDISTTAVFSGTITECFHIPSINDSVVFGKLKVLHSEGGVLIDKTISTAFATRLVCGRTTTLSPFVIANGLAPLATNVTVSGRVWNSNGGLSKAYVTLTDMNGQTRTFITSSFGYFSFENVRTGETYVFTTNHKIYNFTPQVINVISDLSELDFYANEN